MPRWALAACVGGVLGSLAFALQGNAQVPAALQQRIDQAVSRAAAFLKGNQEADGSWDPTHTHTAGRIGMVGLALLEAGVSANDPTILKAAAAIRKLAGETNQVYDACCAIYFLDRLGDPADEKLIRTLALRLVWSQLKDGGWDYSLAGGDGQDTSGILRSLQSGSWSPVIQDTGQLSDNSNTQFAVMALWIARRHDLPLERPLLLAASRFKTSQYRDGSWGYSRTPSDVGSYAMTCAGLLSIAMGHGTVRETFLKSREKPASDAKPNPEKPQPPPPPPLPDPLRDPNIVAGHGYLAQLFNGQATHAGLGKTPLYLLWSVERVAMIYDWKRIGNQDWYLWGADYLLRTQQPSGAWDDPPDSGVAVLHMGSAINTAFAILFLKRANLAMDLTSYMKGEAVLRVSDRPAKPTPSPMKPADSDKPSDPNKPTTRPDPQTPVSNPNLDPNPSKPAQPPVESEASKLAGQLVAADGSLRPDVLRTLRDASGPVNTQALVEALYRTFGQARDDLRAALAQRLGRMNERTLRAYLQHDEPELRRAAAWAAALRDEKAHIPDLIPMLNDRDAGVRLTVHASLKAITRTDQGSEAEAWLRWWNAQKQE